MATICTGQPISYDRREEVQEFEETKLGVKGLVDSGITRVPRIFHHPPESRSDLAGSPHHDPDQELIPVIDLSRRRQEVVELIRDASAEFMFFQVTNHGIPVSLLHRLVNDVKAFHELPAEEKVHIYGRDTTTGVAFFSNIDLFRSKAASWRDTLHIRLGPNLPDHLYSPPVCRDVVIEWDKEVKHLGERLLTLFSEGLGVNAEKLNEMSCSGGRLMVGQYYPHCPEPEKTVGIASHTDPGVLTVLLQDQVGGLQVKHKGKWLNVKPIDGALVINVGDLLQMISNDAYKSGEHRVLANPLKQPRVSTAVFFTPSVSENLYGPLPELLSPDRPAHYQQFTYSDFILKFFSKELSGELLDYFRLQK